MSHIIKFSAQEWNAMKELQGHDKYPYMRIYRNLITITNKKVVYIKNLKKDVTDTPLYIHRSHMAKMLGDTFVRIKISDKGVWIRYMERSPVKVKDANTKVKFPKIKKLKIREKKQSDESITFHISKSVLQTLLNCTTNQLTITAHSDTRVARWESGNAYGYFSQLKISED